MLQITPVFGTLMTWVTPIWLIGLGALLGWLLLLVAWGIVAIYSRRTARLAVEAVREGILWPVLIIVSLFTIIGIVCTFAVEDRKEILTAISRIPYVGTHEIEHHLQAADGGSSQTTSDQTEQEQSDGEKRPFFQPSEQAVPVNFRVNELRYLVFDTSEDIFVSTRPEDSTEARQTFRVTGGNTFNWFPPEKANLFFPDPHVESLFIRNLGTETAEINITQVTALHYPEVKSIPLVAISILAIFAIYLACYTLSPKVSAIAFSTAKSEMAQPIFMVAMSLGVFLLLVFIFIPYNTFGEDVKMLKDSGLTLLMVLSLLVAVYSAGSSVAEEIEGRTALTVLSKPVGRRQFILGKFLGITWVVFLIFLILGAVFLTSISYKVVYDARETANPDPLWQDSFLEISRTLPGIVLAFFETIVLTSLSIAISTRLPLLANFVVMFAVYVLGHLTPLIVQSSQIREVFEPVVFIGKLIATVVPVLDHFNVQAAVAAGVQVPLDYLGWSLVYCALFTTLFMLLALTLFEDRDLA